jgi:hypothetical protein
MTAIAALDFTPQTRGVHFKPILSGVGEPHLDRLAKFSLGELMTMEVPERRCILGPWLRTAESAMVWAPTGVGKSWFALSCALAVAGGGTFLGWAAEAPRRVLYIDGEMSLAELRERMGVLLQCVPGIDSEAASRNLDIYCRQHQEPEADFWDILKPEHHTKLVRGLTRGRYALVIFDNFTTLSDSLQDENAVGALKPATALMMKLKAAGVATMLIHHANKGGDSYRGSTALAATFEAIWGLKALEDGSVPDGVGARFLLELGKFRGRRDDTMDERKVWLAADGWHAEPPVDPQVMRLVRLLSSRRFINQTELAAELGTTQGTVSKRLAVAVHQFGLLTQEDVKRHYEAAKAIRSSGLEPGPDDDF